MTTFDHFVSVRSDRLSSRILSARLRMRGGRLMELMGRPCDPERCMTRVEAFVGSTPIATGRHARQARTVAVRARLRLQFTARDLDPVATVVRAP